MDFVIQCNEKKIIKKKKIMHTLSLIHPDLLKPVLKPPKFLNVHDLHDFKIYYVTYEFIYELVNNLIAHNFNLNNKALHLKYDKFLKDIIFGKEQDNKKFLNYENNENYFHEFVKKKWYIDELFYHIYIHDNSIAKIYPSYFNKIYLDDMKLNAKKILFKYYAPYKI